MAQALPTEQGIADKILNAIVDLLTEKLKTDIDADDASRLVTIKVGPRQDDPDSVVILLDENDPDDPSAWSHGPMRITSEGMGFAGNDALRPRGMEFIGGGSFTRIALSLSIEVWGDELDFIVERRNVGQLASILENRARIALKEAGSKIGTGATISDDFGVSVQRGPFWGTYWTDQPEGEAFIVRKRIRLYYICTENWGTSGW